MYQLCPKCGGLGRIYTLGTTTNTWEPCPICHGEMIIHEETGYPPTQHNVMMADKDPEYQQNQAFLKQYLEQSNTTAKVNIPETLTDTKERPRSVNPKPTL